MSKTADEGRMAGGAEASEVVVHPLTGREMQRDFGHWSKAVAADGYEQVSEGPFVNMRT